MKFSGEEESLTELVAKLEELNLAREQIIDKIDKIIHAVPNEHLDRESKRIEIGCYVDILTPGKYKNFRSGHVIKISKDWIHIKNHDGRTTTRKPNNVRVIRYASPALTEE